MVCSALNDLPGMVCERAFAWLGRNPASRNEPLVTLESQRALNEAAAAENLTVRAFILKRTLGVEDIPDFRYKVNRDRKRPQETLPITTKELRMTG